MEPACLRHQKRLLVAAAAAVLFGCLSSGGFGCAPQRDSPVTALAFSPDGGRLVSGSERGPVLLHDANNGRVLQRLERLAPDVERNNANAAMALSFSPDGRLLLVGDQYRRVLLWDTRTWHLARGLRQDTTNRFISTTNFASFSPDGRIVAAADLTRTITLWHVDSGKKQLLDPYSEQAKHPKEHDPNFDWVRSVVFSPNGQYLAAAGSDTTTCVWDVQRGAVLRTLDGNRGDLTPVAFTPDGETLVIGAGFYRNSVRWRTATIESLNDLSHSVVANPVALSPQGSVLACGDNVAFGSGNEVRLLRRTDHAVLHTMRQPRFVTALAFSPDGSRLAAGFDNGEVSVEAIPARIFAADSASTSSH